MDYVIGGYYNKPEILIDEAISYFGKRFSTNFNFEGTIDNNFFMGFIHDNSGYSSNRLISNNTLIRCIYTNQIFNYFERDVKLKNDVLAKIPFDFIYCHYAKDIGIKIFVDKFARQKIYYTKKKPFLFSSSMKFLIYLIKDKTINYNVLNRLLFYGVNIGNEMIFSNINRLNSAEYLHISKKNLITNKYWNNSKEFFVLKEHDINDISFWIDYIFDTFKEAVNWPKKESMISLLSGGIDSTVLLSLLVKELDMDIEALTLKIPGFNERDVQKAKIVAKSLNIPHTIVDTLSEDINIFTKYYSEIFNILEEPVGISGYLSRYRAFSEAKKMGKKVVVLGDGGDDALGFIKPQILKNIKYIKKIYKIPLKFRTLIMESLYKLFKPSLFLINNINNPNLQRLFEILANTNFLQSQNDLQSFFTTFQCINSKELFQITNNRMDLNNLLKPILKECNAYPFSDYNKIGYHRLSAIVNGDFMVNLNISNVLGLIPYTFISNDIFWKKFVPLPEAIKLTGNRDRWIVYEMARKKGLLPDEFFKDSSSYGFNQIYEEEKSFEYVKSYLDNLIKLKSEKLFIPLKPFEKHLDVSYKYIKRHPSAFVKFSAILGTLGWFYSII